MKTKLFASLVFVACLLVGCGKSSEPNAANIAGRKINVVSTVGMINDAVKNIGGDRVDPISLMGPGVDPHLYRPTAGDVQRLEKADIIFYGGLELEGRMTEILGKMGERGKSTVAVGERVPKEHLRELAGFAGKHDPHLWFDVTLWRYAVEAVRDGLIKLDPGSTELYKTNTDAYLKQLDDLHDYVKKNIVAIPEAQRVLVTAHDAFGYFGRQYGMEVIGIQGTSTATEAAAGKIRELADLIVKKKVKSIFVESSVPKATIEALREAVKSRGWNVEIGGQLYSDAMGKDGTPDGTYVGMVKHNVDTIVEALS